MLEEVVKDRMGFENLDHFYRELKESLNVPREKVNFVEEIKWFVLNDNKPVSKLFDQVSGEESFLKTKLIESSKGEKPFKALAYLSQTRQNNGKETKPKKGPINSSRVNDKIASNYENGHMIGNCILKYIEKIDWQRNNIFFQTENSNHVGKCNDVYPQRILECILEFALIENADLKEKVKVENVYRLLGITEDSIAYKYKLALDNELVIKAQLIYSDTEKEIASGINFQISSKDEVFQWNVLIPNI